MTKRLQYVGPTGLKAFPKSFYKDVGPNGPLTFDFIEIRQVDPNAPELLRNPVISDSSP